MCVCASKHMCACKLIHLCFLCLETLSQDRRHFGNRIVKDKHVMESIGYEGGFRRLDRKREKWDERKSKKRTNNSTGLCWPQ